MTDGPRKPPPRFPRPGDPELVRVREDDAPETQREVIRPPPPREPFRVVKGRIETIPELGDRIAAIGVKLDDVTADVRGISTTQAAILGVQRNMALQVDGLGSIVNQRAQLLHEELALLRAVVTGDHEPRLKDAEQEVQKLSAAEKVKVAATTAVAATGKGAAWTGKYASYLTLAAVALRLVAKRWPEFGTVVDELLGGLGL